MNKLSRALEVSLQTVYRWEHGESKPNRENIEKLASTLGVPVQVLHDAA